MPVRTESPPPAHRHPASAPTASPDPCGGGGVVLSNGGAVTLSDHRNDLDCTWRLLCPSALCPMLSFDHFGTEEEYDVLRLYSYDGESDAEATERAVLSGHLPPRTAIAGSSNAVLAQFTSDGTGAGEDFGIDATFECTPGRGAMLVLLCAAAVPLRAARAGMPLCAHAKGGGAGTGAHVGAAHRDTRLPPLRRVACPAACGCAAAADGRPCQHGGWASRATSAASCNCTCLHEFTGDHCERGTEPAPRH